MRRRTLLTGLGGLAGVGGLVGSGAFTSVSADRSVEVDVADDADALLALSPCGGPNGQYVTASGGTVALDVTGGNGNIAGGGDGVNADGLTVVDDALRIENRGTQPVGVWLEVDSRQYNGTDRVQFYFDGDPSTDVVGRSNAYCLGVGESLCVGFSVDTRGLGSGDPVLDSDTMVVNAEAGLGCSPNLSGVNTGPLAYFPLDGDATDATGNGFDGAVSGATFTTDAQVGPRAAAFDTGQYVSVPPIQIDGSLTVAAWIKREDNGDWHAASSQGSNDAGTRNWWLGGYSGANRVHWSIFDGSDTNRRVDSSPGSLPLDEFTHIAGVYDASTGEQTVYVDGTPDGSQTTAPFTPATSADPGAIGAELVGGSPTNQFPGIVDDVRIYDRALSDQEVQDLYSATA